MDDNKKNLPGLEACQVLGFAYFFTSVRIAFITVVPVFFPECVVASDHIISSQSSKKGNRHIRRALHMPALSVVRYELRPFVNLYNRVYERSKIKMKGYVAVQKKLLTIIYALWKKNEAFDENYEPKQTTSKDDTDLR